MTLVTTYISSFSNDSGKLKGIHWILPRCFLLFFLYLSLAVDARTSYTSKEVPVASSPSPVSSYRRWKHIHSRKSHSVVNLPLPVILPSVHRPNPRHVSRNVPSLPGSSPSPHYRSLTTHGHSSSKSPRLSIPSMNRNQYPHPGSGFLSPHLVGVAPIYSNNVTVSSGLSQPPSSTRHQFGCCEPNMVPKQGSHACHCVYPIKLDLLLFNVSLTSNWSQEFLQELAFQLSLRVSQFEISNFYVVGLSGLNISMDITPHTGISFSAADVYAINSSLSLHKVHLDRLLVGDYIILNITWFKPFASSPAPTFTVSSMANNPRYPSSISGATDRRKNANTVIVISIGIFLLMVIMCMLVIWSFTSSKRKRAPVKETVNSTEKTKTPDVVSVEGSLPHPTSTRFLTYEELRGATNNFEPSSMLGEGGFGRVFKGVLSDGTPVAIKKLTSGGHQGDKEFLVEVEMLTRLHHRNLVKLVGYYSNRDSSQNLLCYELVPNGSLEDWLHGPLGTNCPLDWDTRMKIALDAARGLAYLHEDSQPCVIHRDFKASNILLENDFHAKLSDFGLAKQAPEGRSNYLSTRVMGTFGYVAPEYAMTGHLLVKSDVYSYGVVLLELLSGRKPVDMSQPSGQQNLVTWARPLLRNKDHLEELVDPKLLGKYPKDDLTKVCTIAAACVALEASQRPTMGEVVQSLKMVQRFHEYNDSALSTSTRPNLRNSSTTLDYDGTSSMFSSGPSSSFNAFDTENVFSRTTIFSEDLREGR